jgi:hypothetical protein
MIPDQDVARHEAVSHRSLQASIGLERPTELQQVAIGHLPQAAVHGSLP